MRSRKVVSPDDAKPNSKDVPDVQGGVHSQFERVVILRFKYDTELLSAIEKAVKDNNIRNGVIFKSWLGAELARPSGQQSDAAVEEHVRERIRAAPADIVGMSGMILNGRLHPHITLASPDKTFAGIGAGDERVRTFCVMTIGVLPDNAGSGRGSTDKSWR